MDKRTLGSLGPKQCIQIAKPGSSSDLDTGCDYNVTCSQGRHTLEVCWISRLP